jgi:acetoin utilization deacetylase AcuC-like enzyme
MYIFNSYTNVLFICVIIDACDISLLMNHHSKNGQRNDLSCKKRAYMYTATHKNQTIRPSRLHCAQRHGVRRRLRCAIRANADGGAGAAAAAAAAARPAAVCMFEPAPGHAKQGHPECPERLAAIQTALQEAALLEGGDRAFEALTNAAAGRWRGDRALEALARVHSTSYLSQLERACASLSERGAALVDESTYIAPGTYRAGLDATAAALACLEAALTRRRPAFCFCRPPGHHVAARPMGFGAVNVIAGAAAAALAAPGGGVERVAIFDFDVHHGNGTEDLLRGNDAVMYISMHQAGLWPYTGKITSNNVGSSVGGSSSSSGSGATIINIPLPGGAGDAAARAVMERVVAPAIARFAPDALLVSAGFDAHFCDPLAAMQLASSTYHYLAAACVALAADHCGGRCLFVLEGGYDLASLGEAAAEASRGVLGLPPMTPPARELETAKRLLQPEPMDKVDAAIEDVLRRHAWIGG